MMEKMFVSVFGICDVSMRTIDRLSRVRPGPAKPAMLACTAWDRGQVPPMAVTVSQHMSPADGGMHGRGGGHDDDGHKHTNTRTRAHEHRDKGTWR